MNNTYTDEIVAVGLVIALLIYITAGLYIEATGGTPVSMEFAGTVAGGLLGFLRGMTVGKNKTDNTEEGGENENSVK